MIRDYYALYTHDFDSLTTTNGIAKMLRHGWYFHKFSQDFSESDPVKSKKPA